MLRRDLWQHLEICPAGVQVDCPWGCGCRLGIPLMEAHKAECLMEPRKLLAAIQKLQQENQRLTAENHALRDEQQQMMGVEGRPGLRKLKQAKVGPGSCVD